MIEGNKFLFRDFKKGVILNKRVNQDKGFFFKAYSELSLNNLKLYNKING
jgi:hypothetical protein